MNRNYLLILLLCLGFCHHAQAQADDALADSLLAQARSLQERGDADSSLLVLNQVLEIRSFSPTATTASAGAPMCCFNEMFTSRGS